MLIQLRNDDICCYLMGDYNMNLLNYGRHSNTTDFVDISHANSFMSLINRPTRVKQESATLIDNIFTNSFASPDKTFQCLIYTDITDHFPIVHVDYSSKYNKPAKDSVQRNLSERNKQAFREALATLKWKEIYDENDAQGAFSAFHSIVLKLYNKHFSKRKIKTTYTTHKQWLSQGLKESIKIMNKLLRMNKKNGSVENETKYKIYRNKLNHLLKQAEKKHYPVLLEANKDS